MIELSYGIIVLLEFLLKQEGMKYSETCLNRNCSGPCSVLDNARFYQVQNAYTLIRRCSRTCLVYSDFQFMQDSV